MDFATSLLATEHTGMSKRFLRTLGPLLYLLIGGTQGASQPSFAGIESMAIPELRFLYVVVPYRPAMLMDSFFTPNKWQWMLRSIVST